MGDPNSDPNSHFSFPLTAGKNLQSEEELKRIDCACQRQMCGKIFTSPLKFCRMDLGFYHG
jgi:hypothetical protein